MRIPFFTCEIASGVLARGIGLVYLVSFVSLRSQILELAGKNGLYHTHDRFKQLRHDFGRAAFLYFPSLLWVTGVSDFNLHLLASVGILSSLCSIVGVHSQLALLICWLVHFSLSLPCHLFLPWDCMLFEAGLLALLLPSVFPITQTVASNGCVHPWLHFSFRLLIIRVVAGFGKTKFTASLQHLLQHSSYIKGFMIWQVLPPPTAWLAYRLPLCFFQIAYFCMYIGESFAPFLLLHSGQTQLVGSWMIVCLMVGIHLTANFGHFNLLTVVVCLGTSSLPAPLPEANAWEIFVRGFCSLYCGSSLAYLNHDIHTLDWPYRPEVQLNCGSRIQKWMLGWARILSNLRILHSYGVMGVTSNPPVHISPLFEISSDGIEWQRLLFNSHPSSSYCRPLHTAPFFLRIEQLLYMYCIGGAGWNNLHPGARASPYLPPGPPLLMLSHRLLQGHMLHLFKNKENHPLSTPAHVRVRLGLLVPTTLTQLLKSGKWWEEIIIHDNFLPCRPALGKAKRLSNTNFSYSFNSLLFHPDWYPLWRHSCPPVARFLAAAMREPDATRISALAAHTFCEEHGLSSSRVVSLFWEEFIPFASRIGGLRAWNRLQLLTAEQESRWPADIIHAFRLIVGGLSLVMLYRLEQVVSHQRFGRDFSYLECCLHMHVGILNGAAHVSQLLSESSHMQLGEGRLVLTDESFTFLLLFWPDAVRYHAEAFWFMSKVLRGVHARVLKSGAFDTGFVRVIAHLASVVPESCFMKNVTLVPPDRFGDWAVLY